MVRTNLDGRLLLSVLAAMLLASAQSLGCSSTPSDPDPAADPTAAPGGSDGTTGGGTGGGTSSGGAGASGGTDAGTDASSIHSGGPGCALPSAAFCDTFDAPAGVGNRSGQLDGRVWGVSRGTAGVNIGQGQLGTWLPVDLDACGVNEPGTLAPNDIQICNGKLVEGVSDNHSVTALTMYVKQPFDIAGRTGTIAFDVSNDTHGTHRAWPEIWYTDKPVPSPFAHFDSWRALPQNGFGVRLAGYCLPNEACGACPGVSTKPRMGLSGAIIINNYVPNDSDWTDGHLQVQPIDCVEAPTDESRLNHVEIRVAQNLIEVYATDAGTTAPLKKIGVINNPGLSLTRGFVWIEDAHYNGDKDGPDQGNHSFAWDNVGFDGPILPRDLAFDVIDKSPTDLGWFAASNTTTTALTVPGVTGIEKASAGILTINFSVADIPTKLTYVVNGHSHSMAWPYPDKNGSSQRTLAFPVPLSEVVPGANTLAFGSDAPSGITVMNIDMVLVGAAGVQ